MTELRDGVDYPMPNLWSKVHERLRVTWRQNGGLESEEPPRPLILGGWQAPSEDKRERWVETIHWSVRFRCYGALVREIELRALEPAGNDCVALMRDAFLQWESIRLMDSRQEEPV